MKMHVGYDWSVKKLAEAPDDEECGAGVPLPVLIGMDLASGPDSTAYACREHLAKPHPTCPTCAEVARLALPQEPEHG
jgi:hypothetical protein